MKYLQTIDEIKILNGLISSKALDKHVGDKIAGQNYASFGRNPIRKICLRHGKVLKAVSGAARAVPGNNAGPAPERNLYGPIRR